MNPWQLLKLAMCLNPRWLDRPSATHWLCCCISTLSGNTCSTTAPTLQWIKGPAENTELWVFDCRTCLCLQTKWLSSPSHHGSRPLPPDCVLCCCWQWIMKGHFNPNRWPSWSRRRVLTTACRDSPVNFKSTVKGHTGKHTHNFVSYEELCTWLWRTAVLFYHVSSHCCPVF